MKYEVSPRKHIGIVKLEVYCIPWSLFNSIRKDVYASNNDITT